MTSRIRRIAPGDGPALREVRLTASLSVPSSVSPMKTLPEGEIVETGQGVEQRGLPRPRRTHDRSELPLVEFGGDPVEGSHLGVALSVDL